MEFLPGMLGWATRGYSRSKVIDEAQDDEEPHDPEATARTLSWSAGTVAFTASVPAAPVKARQLEDEAPLRPRERSSRENVLERIALDRDDIAKCPALTWPTRSGQPM